MLLLSAVALTGGCKSLAPKLIQTDRTALSTAISDSWREVTLQNIVRLRYGDVPVFLDVSSVISSNSVETSGEFQASSAPFLAADTEGEKKFFDGLSYSVGGSRKYTDRPTITYTPLTGEKMARNLMRPIAPSVIFSLVQAGYPVDMILQFCVRAVNGVYNRSSSPGRARPADPKFYEMLDAMRRLQQSEALGMRLERQRGEETAVMFFSNNPSDELAKDAIRVREILGINEGDMELTLTFGAISRNKLELAVLSRSLTEIMLEVASEIEVPAQHVEDGRTTPNHQTPENHSPRDLPMLRIHSSPLPIHDSNTAIWYRNHAFWISDRDIQSKKTFTFLLMLFPLAESGATPQIPIVTVPVN